MMRLGLLVTLAGLCGSGMGQAVEGSGEGSGEVFPDRSPSIPSSNCALDLVILLDASGSMRGDNFDKQVGWAQSIVKSLGVSKSETRVGAVMFTGYAHTEFNLNTYFSPKDISDHLGNMRFRSGVTRTGNALRQAEGILSSPSKGARDNAAKLIVLFTDGLSIDDPLPISMQLREELDVTILTLAVAKNSYMPELLGIAGLDENVFAEGGVASLLGRVIEEEAVACSRDPILPVIQPSPRAQTRKSPTVAPTELPASTAEPSTTLAPTSAATEVSSTEQPSSEQPFDTANPSTLEPATEATVSEVSQSSTAASAPAESEVILSTALPLEAEEEEGSGEEEDSSIDDSLSLPVVDGIEEEPAILSESTIETNITTVGSFAKDTQATIKVSLTTILSDTSTTAQPTTEASTTVASSEPSSTAVPSTEPSTFAPPTSTENIVPSILVRAASVESSSSEDPEPIVTEISELLAVKAFDETAFASDVRRVPGLDLGSPVAASESNVRRREPSQSLSFSPEHCQTDFLVLLDSSGSVSEEFHLQKQLVRDLVDLIEIGPAKHRLAVMQFAGKAIQKLNFPFAAYQSKEALEDAVERIRPILAGTTYLGEALRKLRDVLDLRRPDARTLLVVITDGYSQDDAAVAAEELRRDYGVEFLAVSLAAPSNPGLLRRITGSSSAVFQGPDQARHFLNLVRSAQRCLQ